ncbi:alpha/beta hydrolase [Lentzea sp. NBRC 105346]|uniref:alpha/beta fold hydrolase n=1 Tax=Lentzea sp. NBRC 105346 TaxID=3032205 RepID=UPI002553E259|nr:alpha/beta hydrolase [Lentzea sp. NBRC 105346]GLZ30733.1 alpha/beta hydrolase [Lentzea sp. NBRC 105346]
MQLTHVTSAGGGQLAVREAGTSDGPPVVLIHGWVQSGEVWDLPGFHTYALDLRGHGLSDDFGDYRDGAQWAADLKAVLDHTGTATVVGWSYGGLVIADYVRHHGTANVNALVLVSAITEIGRRRPGGATGPVMRRALPDAITNDDAMREFQRAQAPALPVETVDKLTVTALKVPPKVRGELFRRDVGSADVLETIDVPTLVVHGEADLVVAPEAAEYAAGLIPGAELSWYADTAHVPFLERPAEFARDLARFV